MVNLKSFDKVKKEVVADLLRYVKEVRGEDADYTKDGEFNFPVVGEDGEEGAIKVTVIVPKGSRDGEEYDLYGERDAYKLTLQKRAQKAEEKAKKIARDSEKRAKAKEEKTE